MRRTGVALVIVLVGCTEHGERPGPNFNYQLSGTVTEATAGPAIGDSFAATITFSSPIDTVEESSDSATYRCPHAGMSASVNGETYGGDALLVSVVDRLDGDSIVFQAEHTTCPDCPEVSWQVDDASGTAFDGTDFGNATRVGLTQFTQPFGLVVSGGGMLIRGTVEQLTVCCF